MKILVDYASATTWYVGYAEPGTATSAALWRIVRITLNAAGDVTAAEFANGNRNFVSAFDDRAALSYS